MAETVKMDRPAQQGCAIFNPGGCAAKMLLLGHGFEH
ncbi:hypothetical protein HNP83_005547 [Rhizobium leguminosarum]|nr:hypothetical protein [Rhizobium leguminosarum]